MITGFGGGQWAYEYGHVLSRLVGMLLWHIRRLALLVSVRGLLSLWVYSSGKGQPLSFILSFGEIPWFDVYTGGKYTALGMAIKSPCPGNSYWAHTNKRIFRPVTALFFPRTSNHGNVAKRQCERQWLTPPTQRWQPLGPCLGWWCYIGVLPRHAVTTSHQATAS